MAWSKPEWSEPMGAKPKNTPAPQKRTARLIGAVAGLIVVGALTAYFMLAPSKETVPNFPVPPKATKAVKPMKTAKPVTAAKKPAAVRDAKPTPMAKMEVVKPVEEVKAPPPVTISTNSSWARTLSREARIFKNPADAAIAVLLNTELGTSFVGDSSMYHGRHFKRAIDQALAEPVVIRPEDTPDVVELKKAVEETKQELRRRRDNGEDVSKILADTRDDLRTLGVYRNELESQVKSVLRSGDNKFTQKDLDDLVAAANQMLHDRGVTKKIVLPKFLERRALKWARENEGQDKEEPRQ